MDRQDRELEGLERTVRSTRHVALAVGEELELQSGLLEALDDDVGATGARLRAAGRQLAAVARRPGECRSLCTGLLALFVAAVVAVLLIRIVRLL
jgi:SYP5 family syntaxin